VTVLVKVFMGFGVFYLKKEAGQYII